MYVSVHVLKSCMYVGAHVIKICNNCVCDVMCEHEVAIIRDSVDSLCRDGDGWSFESFCNKMAQNSGAVVF